MIALQTPTPRSGPSQQDIASAVGLLRAVAPGTLASLIHGAFDTRTIAPNGRCESGAGLAPWQFKRAKALFESHLQGGIAVAQVARACGLSRSHFSHAFHILAGMAPHAWLIHRRVEKARELLAMSSLPLCEIALACGFSDQSHLTRQFHRATGVTPRNWRRLSLTGKPGIALSAPCERGSKLEYAA